MPVKYSKRLNELPPYLFAEIDAVKKKMAEEGRDVIDLSVGDPDMPAPAPIVERMKEAVADPKNHRYPFGPGMIQFREAAAEWYKKRFGVILDPETEIIALIGSKEGIAHIPLAFVNPGDTVLVPSPAYPVYSGSTVLAGGRPFYMPLLPKNGFIPDLDAIPRKYADAAVLMFINYPNNPTSASAGADFFAEAVSFAAKRGIIICHDAAYSEIAYDGYRPESFLQTEGAKDTGIEFHSLSKTFNMTGWRIGFAAGNRDIIKGLSMVKSNIDSGVFRAVQCAATCALEDGGTCLKEQMCVYKERRDILVDGLNRLGWKVDKPKATFYVWVPVPPGRTSKEMAMWLLEERQIIVTPGNGFGMYGEGYIRFSLTAPSSRIEEALERLSGDGIH